MPDRFTTHRRVEFCETDAAGIVHFSSVLCYMEQAEHAFLRSLGFSVMQPLSGGKHLSWPRVRAECDYLGRMQFEDILEIQLSILRLGRTSCTYRFDFFSSAAKLVARGVLVAVCCQVCPAEAVIKPVPIPDEFRARFSPFLAEH